MAVPGQQPLPSGCAWVCVALEVACLTVAEVACLIALSPVARVAWLDFALCTCCMFRAIVFPFFARVAPGQIITIFAFCTCCMFRAMLFQFFARVALLLFLPFARVACSGRSFSRFLHALCQG
jgi:hypothetical protein